MIRNSTSLIGCIQKFVLNNPIRLYSTSLPSHRVLKLPALSPTMKSGSLISWSVKVGDLVEEGDVVADIETDKASMGFEIVEGGYVAKLLVDAGTKNISLGTPICILVDTLDDVNKFAHHSIVDEKSPAAAASENIKIQQANHNNPKTTIPHYYINSTIDLNKIYDLNIPTLAFIVKAAALASKDVPAMNSVWMTDKIRQYSKVNIRLIRDQKLKSIVINDAINKSISEISKKILEENGDDDDDKDKSTFTIKTFDSVSTLTSAIASNQSGVLCVGGFQNKDLNKTAKIVLSCDHRVVDGAVGAEWVKCFREKFVNPFNLI